MNSNHSKIIPINEPSPSVVRQARVIFASGSTIGIEADGETREAKLAFSCLVRPEPEDIVMYARQVSGPDYVLGIMERPGTADMTVELKGDATVRNTSGSLSLVTNTAINLLAGKKINCLSDRVVHKSREAVFDCGDVTAQGKSLHASFARISVLSEMISSMAKQVIQRFKSYIRHSEQFDQVKSGQMTREVSGMYSMDSKYTVMVSKKDTKIDGERIHMG
jgi:hypothetical protein